MILCFYLRNSICIIFSVSFFEKFDNVCKSKKLWKKIATVATDRGGSIVPLMNRYCYLLGSLWMTLIHIMSQLRPKSKPVINFNDNNKWIRISVITGIYKPRVINYQSTSTNQLQALIDKNSKAKLQISRAFQLKSHRFWNNWEGRHRKIVNYNRNISKLVRLVSGMYLRSKEFGYWQFDSNTYLDEILYFGIIQLQHRKPKSYII